MKTRIIIVAGIILCAVSLALGALAAQVKWQDALAKPTHAWMASFGYSDGSQLAYHVTKLMQNDQRLEMRIEVLEKRIATMEQPVDPNAVDIKAPDPNEPAKTPDKS